MNRSETAAELFKEGFACSQAVAAACADMHDIPKEVMLAALGGFGGGCRCGEVCGALSGAVATIGLVFPYVTASDAEAKQLLIRKSAELSGRFREEFSAVRCTEILKTDVSTPELMQKAKEEGKTSGCPDVVRFAVGLTEEIYNSRKS